MTDSDRVLKAGMILHERYQIEKALGQGGFGITYLARDLVELQKVAVKEYMPEGIAFRERWSRNVRVKPGEENTYERFRQKFLEEAKIIYRYRKHPNIISVSHLFAENNTAYYVMEYIDGDDLDGLLRRKGGRMTWRELYPIMAQMTEALRDVHKSGVIHCDISPDNIFILRGGQVKLIDFGAAKSEISQETTMILMKKGFAPPEQYAGRKSLGPWTDVYAVAVTIYRAYTGKMPPDAPERLECDRIVWPTQMGLEVPSYEWEQTLKKGLALRVEDRFQSMEEFWNALNRKGGSVSISFGRRLALEGKKGVWLGRQIWPQGEVLFGTDRSRCQVCFPPDTPGISRVHFRVWNEADTLWIMDMGSRYGTYIGNNRLTPGLGYRLEQNMRVTIGNEQIFEIVMPEIT